MFQTFTDLRLPFNTYSAEKVPIIRNIIYFYNKAPVKDLNGLLYHKYVFQTIEKREQLNAIREITHLTPN